MSATHSVKHTGHEHDHVFLGQNHERNERRTWFVIGLIVNLISAVVTARGS